MFMALEKHLDPQYTNLIARRSLALVSIWP